MAALSEIEKLEARWAENPDGRYFAPLADAYRKAGRVDEAITVATGGLGKHPDYLSAHIVLGRCFLAKKDDGSARGAFERVLALDGENIIALKSLAEIAEREGAVDDARRWLQRLLTIDAMNAEAAEDLARLGGPLEPEGAAAEAPVEAEGERISFADLAPELSVEPPPAPAPEPVAIRRSETTQQVPAVDMAIPRTLERPAISADQARMAQDRTLGMDAVPPAPAAEAPASEAPAGEAPAAEAPPMLEVERVAFEPPAPEELPATPMSPDLVPFDDKLEWGAGERQSESIHAEDIARAEASHEATASAIEFLGGAPAPESPEPVAEAAAESSLVEPEPPVPTTAQPAGVEILSEAMTLDVAPETPAAAWEHQHSASAAYQMPVTEPEASALAPAHDLPLIMPEDVTPPEELRRPSFKQVQMVSPEPVEVAAGGAELLITETMGDLYLRQGFKDQAAEVYRRLLAGRPSDAGLKAKLTAIESPPAFSATALGAEAVGSWLRRLAQAVLPTQAPAAPPPPEAGPSPMEQAFQASEAEPAAPAPEGAATAAPAQPEGSPARPATDAYSLDQIFGAGGTPAARTPPPAAPTAPANVLGASFDEFFGTAPKTETVRPKEASPTAARQSEDDLSAFNAWLHGLKR